MDLSCDGGNPFRLTQAQGSSVTGQKATKANTAAPRYVMIIGSYYLLVLCFVIGSHAHILLKLKEEICAECLILKQWKCR
jgi:hypothetical protein